MKTITKIGVLACLLIGGCKKDTQLLTNKTGLQHSWKLLQQGSDINKNNTFDTEEKNLVLDSAQFTYQFKGDGTGFLVGSNNTYVDSLHWDLINNENLLYIGVADKGFLNKQYYQYQYGTKTLILTDTSTSPVFFRYFERQD